MHVSDSFLILGIKNSNVVVFNVLDTGMSFGYHCFHYEFEKGNPEQDEVGNVKPQKISCCASHIKPLPLLRFH